MATLEKIRSKSVLLFVIIIVALLAFILGDFLTSGRNLIGNGTTMAEVGGVKVDYTDYQKRINEEQQLQQQQQQQRQIDNGVQTMNVINDLLVEKMLDKEYDDLGITVTDAEISEAMTGETPHPYAQQFIYQISQYLGLQRPSGADVLAAIKTPSAHNLTPEIAQQLTQSWAQLEEAVEQAMLREKFDRLMLGLFTANELDAQSLYNDVSSTRHIQYAYKEFSTVDAKDAEITDADRKAAWEENKELYRLDEEGRSISYIYVPIQPSTADRTAGQKAVEDAVAALNAQPGTEGVAADSRFVVSPATVTYSMVRDNQLKAYLDSAEVGEAVLLKNIGDNYTLVKLLDVTTEIDSINVSFLGRADNGSLDSLTTKLAEGATFASLIDNVTVGGQDSIWASFVNPQFPAELKKALTEHAIGEAFVYSDTTQATPVQAIYRVNKRNAPVKVYSLAEISFVVDPSQETLSELKQNLTTFVANNSSAELFKQNAAEAGYNVQKGYVTASSPMLGNASDSRQFVKWAMEAKAGQVMPMQEDSKQSYLLTVAVENVYDGDYLPWNADVIADEINFRALNNKKAQVLLDRYAGKANDLEGYAKLMEVTVQKGDAMFGSNSLAMIGGGENVLQGIIDAAEVGKLVGPVKGNNGVFVFVVDSADNMGREFTAQEYTSQFNNMFNLGNARVLQDNRYMRLLLQGGEKAENYSLKFVQGLNE